MSIQEEGRAQEEGRHQEEEGDQEEEGHQEEEGDEEEVNGSKCFSLDTQQRRRPGPRPSREPIGFSQNHPTTENKQEERGVDGVWRSFEK